VELDYLAEVRRDHEHVDIVARIARVGTKSVTLSHEVLRPDGTVAASGTSVLVAWDMAARCSRELSEEERSRLAG
jgi:acyl-CoA thioester hydrolase